MLECREQTVPALLDQLPVQPLDGGQGDALEGLDQLEQGAGVGLGALLRVTDDVCEKDCKILGVLPSELEVQLGLLDEGVALGNHRPIGGPCRNAASPLFFQCVEETGADIFSQRSLAEGGQNPAQLFVDFLALGVDQFQDLDHQFAGDSLIEILEDLHGSSFVLCGYVVVQDLDSVVIP